MKKYNMEKVKDLQAIHGLDAEKELSEILKQEIIAETILITAASPAVFRMFRSLVIS